MRICGRAPVRGGVFWSHFRWVKMDEPTAWSPLPSPISSGPNSKHLSRDHAAKRHHIGLQGHEQAHQDREREAVPKNIAKDRAFVAVPIRRRARHDDALRV